MSAEGRPAPMDGSRQGSPIRRRRCTPLKRAALPSSLVQVEIAKFVNVGTADNLESTTRLEISRLDIFDVNDILRRIYLLYDPGSGERRANIAGSPQNIFKAHDILFGERLRVVEPCL